MNMNNEITNFNKVREGQHLTEGEWVEYSYNRTKYIGFTTSNQGYNWVDIEVVKPVRELICVPKSYLYISSTQNYSWETPYILELAKSMNDIEWINGILEEKSKWRNIQDI